MDESDRHLLAEFDGDAYSRILGVFDDGELVQLVSNIQVDTKEELAEMAERLAEFAGLTWRPDW